MGSGPPLVVKTLLGPLTKILDLAPPVQRPRWETRENLDLVFWETWKPWDWGMRSCVLGWETGKNLLSDLGNPQESSSISQLESQTCVDIIPARKNIVGLGDTIASNGNAGLFNAAKTSLPLSLPAHVYYLAKPQPRERD